jgi:hypothetical protein
MLSRLSLLLLIAAAHHQAQPVRKIVPSLTDELKAQLVLHNISECRICCCQQHLVPPPGVTPVMRCMNVLVNGSFTCDARNNHPLMSSHCVTGVLLVLPGKGPTPNTSLDWSDLSKSLHRVDVIRTLDDFTAHWHKVHTRCASGACMQPLVEWDQPCVGVQGAAAAA